MDQLLQDKKDPLQTDRKGKRKGKGKGRGSTAADRHQLALLILDQLLQDKKDPLQLVLGAITGSSRHGSSRGGSIAPTTIPNPEHLECHGCSTMTYQQRRNGSAYCTLLIMKSCMNQSTKISIQ